jgi:hypothetical protein
MSAPAPTSTSLRSWQFEWRQWGLTLDVATFFAGHGGDITEQRYAELAAAVGWLRRGCLDRSKWGDPA